MNIYVGNLSYQSSSDTLESAFSAFGTVVKASIVTDRETGRSKGFGFVEMSNADEGQQAIDGLNGKEIDGRSVKVNEARPREDRPRSGGGGNRRSFGGGNGGGDRSRRKSW